MHPPFSTRLLLSSLFLLALVPLQAQTILGDSWRLRTPLPTINDMGSVANTGTALVAAGYGKTVIRSTDHGVTWTAVSVDASGAGDNLGRVAALDSELLFVASDGVWKSGDDGLSWHELATDLGTYDDVMGPIATDTGWALLLASFNAGTYSYKLMTSTDGAHWVKFGDVPTSSLSRSFITALAYGSGRFVLAGTLSGFSQDGYVWSSTDGVTWSQKAFTGGNDPESISDIIWTGQRFVLSGRSSASTNVGAWSDNGTTWTVTTMPVYAITLAKKGLVAGDMILAFGSSQAATSTDGKVWTQVTVGSSEGSLNVADLLWDGTN